MTQPAPMMPPPLPGYPVQSAPPPQAPPAAAAPAFVPPAYAQPAPQGYPGPAVAAPAAPLGAPQQGQPYPAYAQAAPQPAYNPGAGAGAIDIGAAIADATGGDRDPQPPPGTYRFQIVRTIVTRHPKEGRLTLKASLKVLTSNNPNCPPGAEVSYIEGLAYGAGRVQDFIINVMGFSQKALFDQAMIAAGRDPKVELRLVGAAVGNPETQWPGNHYPPNPFAGRVVDATVADVTKIAGENSAKRGQQVSYKNWSWSPAA